MNVKESTANELRNVGNDVLTGYGVKARSFIVIRKGEPNWVVVQGCSLRELIERGQIADKDVLEIRYISTQTLGPVMNDVNCITRYEIDDDDSQTIFRNGKENWTIEASLNKWPKIKQEDMKKYTIEYESPYGISPVNLNFSAPVQEVPTQECQYVAMSQDRAGSRVLQGKLEERNPTEIEAIFQSLLRYLDTLVYDQAANSETLRSN